MNLREENWYVVSTTCNKSSNCLVESPIMRPQKFNGIAQMMLSSTVSDLPLCESLDTNSILKPKDWSQNNQKFF